MALVAAGFAAYAGLRAAVGRPARDDSARLATFGEATAEVLWEITRNGTLTFVSSACREIFRAEPQNLVGTQCVDLVAEDDVERARTMIATAVATKSGWTDQRFRLRRDASLWLETTGVPRVDAAGVVRGFSAVTREVTDHQQARLEREAKVARIENVLAERALQTVFQPIVTPGGREIVGVEALTRFTAQPAETPDRWFALAAEVGRGVELELLALELALSTARQLPPRLKISVNLSPSALLSGRARQVLAGSGIAGERICVEITEHVSVEDYDALLRSLDCLRRLGARIAVDDMGAGYASWRHTVMLRPESIKLDRGLVAGLDADPARRAVTAAVVHFGREVGAKIIAEGVETQSELDVLHSLGVDFVQGYLLGRPTDDPATWATWTSRHWNAA